MKHVGHEARRALEVRVHVRHEARGAGEHVKHEARETRENRARNLADSLKIYD